MLYVITKRNVFKLWQSLKKGMKKELIVLVLLFIFLSGCMEVSKIKPETKLDSLQTTACEEADKAGTCQTRLIEVGIVMPNECCEAIGKCCE